MLTIIKNRLYLFKKVLHLFQKGLDVIEFSTYPTKRCTAIIDSRASKFLKNHTFRFIPVSGLLQNKLVCLMGKYRSRTIPAL